MAKPQVTIECPICGEKSRTTMPATAFRGGWCVGSLDPRDPRHHKPRNYVITTEAA